MNVSPTNGGSIEVDGTAPLSYPAFYTASSPTWATVEAVPASGYDFAGWSGDLAGITNRSTILVDCAQAITANFILQTGQEPTGAIEGFVWEDTDGDGIQNIAEPGINNMMVDLYDSSDNLVQSITTQDGSYAFDGLEPEEYYIFFDAPSPYLFSPMGQGENDDTDSDAGANGRTPDVIIIIGDTLTLDAGMFLYVSSHVDVTEQEAINMIDTEPNLIIIDVRQESAFCGEGGHINGAVNYPWNSGIFEQRYTELPADENILLVCTGALLSRHAAEFLDSKGYTSVFNLLGGMNAWESETVGCDSGGGDSDGGDSDGGDSDGGGSSGGCFITTAADTSRISPTFMLLFTIMAIVVIFKVRSFFNALSCCNAFMIVMSDFKHFCDKIRLFQYHRISVSSSDHQLQIFRFHIYQSDKIMSRKQVVIDSNIGLIKDHHLIIP